MYQYVKYPGGERVSWTDVGQDQGDGTDTVTVGGILWWSYVPPWDNRKKKKNI